MTDDEDTSFRFALTEEQTIALAAGLVPPTIRAQAMAMLDSEDHWRRNAEKPIHIGKRRKR